MYGISLTEAINHSVSMCLLYTGLLARSSKVRAFRGGSSLAFVIPPVLVHPVCKSDHSLIFVIIYRHSTSSIITGA
jgi:hypothetical protein